MMYLVTYERDGKQEQHEVTKVGMLALVAYLKNTFRIEADVKTTGTRVGADR